MAKKTKPSSEDALNILEDALVRASLSDYYYVNRITLSKNIKGNTILVVFDQNLWNDIIDKPEFKDKLNELDLTKSENSLKINLCSYGEDLTNEAWIDLDAETLYNGKIIKISIDGLEYDLSVNKNLIPLKLKKSEFNNISYRVFPPDVRTVLALKKRFDYPLEGYGFTIIRLFQIV